MQETRSPFRRVNIIRLGVAVVIVTAAALAVALPGGFFRVLFRGAVVFGAVAVAGSYLLQWWIRRRRPRP